MSFVLRKLGIRLPIVYKQMGYDLVSTYLDEIKQNLKMVLLTAPGEFPGDPQLGCGLRRKLFEPIIPSLNDSLRQLIYSQLASYLPVVQLVDITFETGSMYIITTIKYYVPSLDVNDSIDLKFNN